VAHKIPLALRTFLHQLLTFVMDLTFVTETYKTHKLHS
jgi:hypothetical protein